VILCPEYAFDNNVLTYTRILQLLLSPPVLLRVRLLGLLLLHLSKLPLLLEFLCLLSLLFTHALPLCLFLGCSLVFRSLFNGGVLALSDFVVLVEVSVDALSGVDEFSCDLIISKGIFGHWRRRTSGLRRFGRSMRSTMLSATWTHALTASTCSAFLGL
jgi:hypothetical protein